jgi:hypothetical protein
MSFLSRLFHRETNTSQTLKGKPGLPIAYAEWACLNDEESCKTCRALDGFAWIPAMVSIDEPPCGVCKSREGCRCTSVFIMQDSEGAPETAEFLRSLGGRAEASQVSAFWEERRAPLVKKRKLQGLASGKSQIASRLEKTDCTQAIALYCEGIQLILDSSRINPEKWDLNMLPHIYNRLTMVLEHNGRAEEGLAQFTAYEALGSRCSDFATAAERQALAKRKMRLLKRASRPSTEVT